MPLLHPIHRAGVVFEGSSGEGVSKEPIVPPTCRRVVSTRESVPRRELSLYGRWADSGVLHTPIRSSVSNEFQSVRSSVRRKGAKYVAPVQALTRRHPSSLILVVHVAGFDREVSSGVPENENRCIPLVLFGERPEHVFPSETLDGVNPRIESCP